MKRGDIYLVKKPTQSDPGRQRAFVIVSRHVLVDSNYESIICAPVYTNFVGLQTQVQVGEDEGLKHESAIHCDGILSISKSRLTDFKGALGPDKLTELANALKVALEIE